MKKSFFVLPIFLSYVSTALASSELVSLDLESTPGQTASYVTVRALSDNLRVSDLTVNGGSCILRFEPFQTTGYSFANILLAHTMGQTKDAKFPRDKDITFIASCQVSNIDEVIVKTNKGIQKAKYSASTKPLISIEPLKDNSVFEVKFETKPLNELYQVSIYTCYQDKDEVDAVAEYCTPLLVDERKDFDLPLSLSMHQLRFPMKAREYAKRARYIEFLETFPKELPEFEKKTRGSIATPSIPSNEPDISKDDRALLNAVSNYEKNLIDLIKTRIEKEKREKDAAVLQEELKLAKKELAKQPKRGLRDKIDDLEMRLSWKLSSLEDDMNSLSSKEKSLELFKEKVKEAKEKAAQTRLQYKNNQQ